MKRLFLVLALLATFTSARAADTTPNSLTPQEVSQGWILLFDGETNFGWAPRGGSQWAVRGVALTYQSGSGGGYLSTTTEFADFQLHAEFWIDQEANSGVFL